MLPFFRSLFDTDFMPRIDCLRGDAGVLWLHVVSDLLIAISFAVISAALVRVIFQRKDRSYRIVTGLFVLFIGASVLTHLLEIWTLWVPMYRLQGLAKAVLALLAVTTALVMIRMLAYLSRIPSAAALESESQKRQIAMERAHEKDERFRAFVESVADYAICMLDPEGIVLTWNHGAEGMTGYTAEEIVGKNFASFYTAEDRSAGRSAEILKTVRETGKFEGELWRVRKDGSKFLAHAVLRPLWSPSGELIGFSNVTRDLTETRAADAKYRTLLEGAPDAIVIVERGGSIVFINAQAERVFGYSREELLGTSIHLLVPAQVREAQAIYLEELFTRASAHPNTSLDLTHDAPAEFFGQRRDGRDFPLDFSVSPLETAEGRLLLFAVRDLTERRRTEARFRALLNSAPDAMVISGPDGLIELTNFAAERLFGYRSEEMAGQPVKMLIPEDLREGYQQDSKQFLQGEMTRGMGAGLELRARRKDGSEVPVEISFSPLDGPLGVSMMAAIRDVTERRRTETRFRMLLDSAPDAMVIVNDAGLIALVNAQTERLFGYSALEMVGQPVEILMPPSLRDGHRGHRTNFLTAPRKREMGGGLDLMAQRKDGSLFPVEISLSPLDGPDGVAVMAGIRDVTERKRTETRFRMLLESAPGAMVIVDDGGVIALSNAQTEKLFGYSSAELIGQPVEILMPSHVHEGHRGHRTNFLTAPRKREMGGGLDLMAQRKDGSLFPVEISLSPLEGPDGRLVTAAIRDVTERKRTETRFRMLLESAPDAMVIVDDGGMIVLSNAQTEKLFGYAHRELVGQPVEILMPVGLHEGHRGHRTHFVAAPRKREMGAGMDLLAQRKDGSLFPVEISLSPLEGPDGRLVTAAIRDVTERVTASRHLAEKMVELRQSNEALEQFAHVASHDLQEPLRMVASYVQLLAKRYKGRLDADADEFIGFAVDGTQRMKRLIEDLLVYSRAGRGALTLKQIDAGKALDEALRNLRVSIEESQAEVSRDALPTLATSELLLVQIFQNLVGNAIKYRGERPPHIHLSARKVETEGGQEWEFSVADNGIGIEPQFFERIFVIFQRLHGKGEYEGTGIGLAICKRVLQQQGGRIWVESEPGTGSVFYFALPVR